MKPVGLPALLAVSALLSATVAGLTGCGDDPGDAAPATRENTPPPSKLAQIAVAGHFRHLDPNFAESHVDRLVSRQLYDPLTAPVGSPLGGTGRRRGPARSLGIDSRGNWRFQFRPDARFQDGTDLDYEALRANVERWFFNGTAAEVLPELKAIDAPAPGQVRFQLRSPVPDLPRRLADPRLGLVSPEALLDASLGEVEGGAGGSGAYELRARGRNRVLLVAAPEWWGRAARLGPGVDRIEMLSAPSAERRLRLLRDSAVEIADELNGAGARRVAREPTLITVPQANGVAGASGAVRGLRDDFETQPLSEIWLTSLRPGN